MNLTSPILKGAVHAAELPGDSVTSFLKMIGDRTGLFADDSPDGWLGLLMSGLSGVAAALAVAIVLTVYFRSGYRSIRDIVRHGLAAALVLGLFAFVAYDMRHAALAYLGINPAKPAVEFEIRLPKAALSDVGRHPDRTAHRPKPEARPAARRAGPGDDGRSVLKGSVALDYRTTERVRGPESAGPGPMPVQAAAGGKPKPLRSVRAVASGRSHRLREQGEAAHRAA